MQPGSLHTHRARSTPCLLISPPYTHSASPGLFLPNMHPHYNKWLLSTERSQIRPFYRKWAEVSHYRFWLKTEKAIQRLDRCPHTQQGPIVGTFIIGVPMWTLAGVHTHPEQGPGSPAAVPEVTTLHSSPHTPSRDNAARTPTSSSQFMDPAL